VCRSHGADEACVEDDQRRARNDVYEKHARPVVDVVVDRLVTRDVGRLFIPARRHLNSRRTIAIVVDVDGIHHQRRRTHGTERQLAEPARLRRNGRHVDADDDTDGTTHRTQTTTKRRVDRTADVRIPLDGQRRRQPDRRRVEDGRQVIRQAEVGKAPRVRHPLQIAPSERVEMNETRNRADARQSVGDGQSSQQGVRR